MFSVCLSIRPSHSRSQSQSQSQFSLQYLAPCLTRFLSSTHSTPTHSPLISLHFVRHACQHILIISQSRHPDQIFRVAIVRIMLQGMN
jgi:hypothetical protein